MSAPSSNATHIAIHFPYFLIKSTALFTYDVVTEPIVSATSSAETPILTRLAYQSSNVRRLVVILSSSGSVISTIEFISELKSSYFASSSSLMSLFSFVSSSLIIARALSVFSVHTTSRASVSAFAIFISFPNGFDNFPVFPMRGANGSMDNAQNM